MSELVNYASTSINVTKKGTTQLNDKLRGGIFVELICIIVYRYRCVRNGPPGGLRAHAAGC
jgi:hypothetical protein